MEQIADPLWQAVVSSEDRRFFSVRFSRSKLVFCFWRQDKNLPSWRQNRRFFSVRARPTQEIMSQKHCGEKWLEGAVV